MGGKHSRTKGHSFEREIANEFKALGYPDARRHLENHSADAEEGIDLIHTGEWLVQCKRYKQYVPLTKLEEVKKVEGKIPLLVTKGDRKETIVAMYWEDFKWLINNERI